MAVRSQFEMINDLLYWKKLFLTNPVASIVKVCPLLTALTNSHFIVSNSGSHPPHYISQKSQLIQVPLKLKYSIRLVLVLEVLAFECNHSYQVGIQVYGLQLADSNTIQPLPCLFMYSQNPCHQSSPSQKNRNSLFFSFYSRLNLSCR